MGAKLASAHGLVIGVAPTHGHLASVYGLVLHEAYVEPAQQADPVRSRDYLWLLDLEVGGHVYRYSTEPVTVGTADGDTLVYDEGLADPGVSYGSVMGVADASVGVVVDSGDVDWSQIVAHGHYLDRCRAVLRRWQPGTVIERARVVLRGLTADPVWGAPEEGLQVSITRSMRDQARTFPDPQAVVDSTTWNVNKIPDISIGLPYPIVIGCPGGTDDTTPIPVVPIPVVKYTGQTTTARDESFFPGTQEVHLTYPATRGMTVTVNAAAADYTLSADGRYVLIVGTVVTGADTVRVIYSQDAYDYDMIAAWIGGHATNVRVRVDGGPPEGVLADPGALYAMSASGTIATGVATDSLGRTLAKFVQAYPMLNGVGSPEDRYFIGFRDDASFGGGILNRRGELMRGAGDVIEWVLTRQFDGVVDLPRLQTVRAYLNRWKIDTYVNDPVNAWDWLTREILPLLPVEMREGSHGVYPAVIRYDLTVADAVAHLDAGDGDGRVWRDGPMTLTTPQIANEITVEYRPVGESGSNWIGRRVLTAQASYTYSGGSSGVRPGYESQLTADTRVLGSAVCAASQRRYGIRPLRAKAAAVWDSATAVLVAQTLAARLAWPRRAVRYLGGGWLEDLEVGQAVTITDAELHLTAALAVVIDVAPDADGASVEVLLLDGPG